MLHARLKISHIKIKDRNLKKKTLASRETDSNHRPKDIGIFQLQSSALPTELSRVTFWTESKNAS